MSLTTCIPDLLERGELRPDSAARLRRFYEERLAELERDLSRPAAEAQATSDALKWLESDTIQKARRSGLQVEAQRLWLKRMEREAGDSGVIPIKAMSRFLRRIDKKADALQSSYFATLTEFVAAHRRNLIGQVRNKTDLEDMGRALHGEKVESLTANELADAVKRTMELARKNFNAAGGNIGKREDFGLPHSHDGQSIWRAGYEAWRANPSIDRATVYDFETGQPARGLKRESILRGIFDTITTDGTNKMVAGQVFAGSLATRRGDPRVIHFESYDDWFAYHNEFGRGETIYDIVVQHLRAMARDTVLMQELGPNPAATVRFMKDSVTQNWMARGDEKLRGKVDRQTAKIQRYYDVLSGAALAPEMELVAKIGSGVRSQQVASKLGSATIAAVTDTATVIHTARFNDIPVMRALAEDLRQWNPLSSSDRRMAARFGFISDEYIGLTAASARLTGEEVFGKTSQTVADFVMRASLLKRWTMSKQRALSLAAVGRLSEYSGRSFDELPDKFRSMLERYDIGRAQWDQYRGTAPRRERGMDWIVPLDMEDRRTGMLFQEMILTEQDFAVVVPDLRTKAVQSRIGRPGSVGRETLSTLFLFKGFPIAFASIHGERMLAQSGIGGKLGYAVPLFAMMTAFGGLSLQMYEIANGRDPLPMDNPQFLGKAILRGGGATLLGDFISGSESRYGQDASDVFIGPVLGRTVPNAADATIGNALRGARGEETNFRGDIWNAAKQEIPGQNLWWSRRATDALLDEFVTRQLDPEADRAFQRRLERMRENGNDAFWRPGEPLPMRGPDMMNAVEGELPQ